MKVRVKKGILTKMEVLRDRSMNFQNRETCYNRHFTLDSTLLQGVGGGGGGGYMKRYL